MPVGSYQDYSVNAKNSARALEAGLAEAEWYTCPIPRQTMRELLQRKNGPAIRDTLIWFALLLGFGYWAYLWYPSWWSVIPFMLYGLIYASSSDSRWHEASHGTAFKTDWMNNALYEVASFMVMRESTPWRWSHTRHHSDTIIVGRDPEIAVPRPPDIKAFIMGFFNIKVYPAYFKNIILHSFGILNDAEKDYIPADEHGKVFWKARVYVFVYAGVLALSLYTHSFLPLLFVGLPNLYGAWLMPIYGYTQHAGLAENVLDHRLNCRTIEMNFVNRYLYWNMNYHVEHHMFPLVPYHALPRLHKEMVDDTPTPYRSLWSAWKEIIPTIFKQVKDPGFYVKRKLPEPKERSAEDPEDCKLFVSSAQADTEGWVEICATSELDKEDVLRFDHGGRTYAVYTNDKGEFFATDGICTHGSTHLATGFVSGNLIECPKHNGRFDVRDGSTKRPPVCVALKTYKVQVRDEKLFLDVNSAGGCGVTDALPTHEFKVVSNENVATFIKELVLEPINGTSLPDYTPGDYIQLNIPTYDKIEFSGFNVAEPYASTWNMHHVFDYKASNTSEGRRNYSIASNPQKDPHLRFNVRIATPPRGQDCDAGIGSSYVFNLKAGDTVTAVGPFGDFHIKDTDKEMIYLGGGAGMAPMRAHLAHLFENLKTGRKVSFWYGARSAQEMFYQDYFEKLASEFPNFSFHVAMSEPQPEDNWTGPTGFIHNVLNEEYLSKQDDPKSLEYYLCGPPAMMQAATGMLAEYGISKDKIAYDEF